MNKFYRLDIDEVYANLLLSTEYDVGGEGHGIIVKKAHLRKAIEEITNNFSNLIEESFEPYEEEG